MYKQLEHKCDVEVIRKLINYMKEISVNDPETKIDFDNLDEENINRNVSYALSVLLECYNDELYEFEGDLENDLHLCRSEVFSSFIICLDSSHEMSDNVWDKTQAKLYELLDITDVVKNVPFKIEADKKRKQ